MKQVVQNLESGETRLAEAPAPAVAPGSLLIRSNRTLISAGTERMLVDFGRSSLIAKARKQPERVAQVFDKMKTDGVMTTIDAVRSKLAQPLSLGYCNVGTVVAVGSSVTGYSVGDRVASNGAHADLVHVPQNLCAKIPDDVTDDSAVFTVISAIGLQGIRLAQPTLGESFVVTGVGLIGLLVVQMLVAQGCRVLAVDFDDAKLALAARFGAKTCNPSKGADPVSEGLAFSRGRGVDGVIIAASTQSSDPVIQAARMSRVRGRIVLVGVSGLELNRADFYEKELSFQVSCSYGPGRYDPDYEARGKDYPFGHVRWTEQRNFEAVLDLMTTGALTAGPLISHRVPFDDAPKAYELLTTDPTALGIVLEFPERPLAVIQKRHVEIRPAKPVSTSSVGLAVIGAGNYASRVLVPAFKKSRATLRSIVSSGGLNSVLQGEALGFEQASSDVDSILSDQNIAAIAIATRHDSHAELAARALEAGKHVFVEKPLVIDFPSLGKVESAWMAAQNGPNPPLLTVGFNRRFSPQIVKAKSLLDAMAEPKVFIITVNAGFIPQTHWTQDPQIGGGRIVGEACHFVDLMRHLAGAPIIAHQTMGIAPGKGVAIVEDKVSIQLSFADGSYGTIHYLANGASSFPKERVEIFAGGRVLQIDNFRKMSGFGWPGFRSLNLWRQDKGQQACAAAFVDAILGGAPSPIPPDELFEVARVTLEVAESIRR